jgi:hypothetical protein
MRTCKISYQHKNGTFSYNWNWEALSFCNSLFNDGRPDVRVIQVGLSDRMRNQRSVRWFILFPVGGARFSLQNLLFSPSYFVALLICISGELWVLEQTLCRIVFVLLKMNTSKGLLVSPVSATIIGDALHTLHRLLGVSNSSSFNHYSKECRFSFGNGSNI